MEQGQNRGAGATRVKSLKKSASVIAAAMLATVLAGPAAAQRDWVNPDVVDLRQQVERLQREVDQMRGGGSGFDSSAGSFDAGAGAGGSAGAYDRVSRLENELRRLTGALEQLEYRVRQTIADRDTRILDLEYRVLALEGDSGAPQPMQDFFAGQAAGESYPIGLGAEGNLGEPPTILGEIPSENGGAVVDQPNFDQPGRSVARDATVSGGGGGDFQAALEHLQAGSYGEATSEFQGFIDANPGDPRVGEATYWLGEIQFQRGEYQTAARTFHRSFKEYPRSPRAPDSLLKLGMSLAQLDHRNEACTSYSQVSALYPDASNVLRRANAEAQRAGCN